MNNKNGKKKKNEESKEQINRFTHKLIDRSIHIPFKEKWAKRDPHIPNGDEDEIYT